MITFQWTEAGYEAVWNARNTGVELELTHLQLGAGYTPMSGAVEVLGDARETASFTSGQRVSATQRRLIATFSDVATAYDVHEIGIWSGVPGESGSILCLYWSQEVDALVNRTPGTDYVWTNNLAIDAALAGSITVTVAPSAAVLAEMIDALMPSGTRLVFAQPSAPPGWVQIVDSSADNRMLRVVTAAGGAFGGSHSPILMDVVPAHTHGVSGSTGAESADHTHAITVSVSTVGTHQHAYGLNRNNAGSLPAGSGQSYAVGNTRINWDPNATENTDPSGSHTHTAYAAAGGVTANHLHSFAVTSAANAGASNWTPRYIDVIVGERL